ncbi:MAG TPA: hypothetical protein VGK33_19720 [Chloroflexota bacterium]
MTDPMDTPVLDRQSGFPTEWSKPPSRPGSVEWLLDAVQRHATAEQDALARYEYLGASSGDPVIALVMQLILEDEERHHGLLKRIETTLRDALNWTRSPAALPLSAPPRLPVAVDLVETARALVKEERTGAHHLRALAQQDDAARAGLQSVLLEMMAMDSEKHARLLQFVHDRLASRARGKTDQFV